MLASELLCNTFPLRDLCLVRQSRLKYVGHNHLITTEYYKFSALLCQFSPVVSTFLGCASHYSILFQDFKRRRWFHDSVNRQLDPLKSNQAPGLLETKYGIPSVVIFLDPQYFNLTLSRISFGGNASSGGPDKLHYRWSISMNLMSDVTYVRIIKWASTKICVGSQQKKFDIWSISWITSS